MFKDAPDTPAAGQAPEPPHEALEALVRLIERQAPGTHGSVLVMSQDGRHLLHGAAPSLPKAYNDAIHGIEIGEAVGSCGTAAFRKQQVIVRDIATDPLWAGYRDLALGHHLQACWSTPILSADREVLGTFAMYYDEPMAPTPGDEGLIDSATMLARAIIERWRGESRLAAVRRQRDMILGGIRDGVVVWSRDGRMVYANEAAARMTGYRSPADMLHAPAHEARDRFDVLDEEDQPVAASDLPGALALATGQDAPERLLHFRPRRGKGEEGWSLVRASALRDADGRLDLVVSVLKDVTDRMRYQRALEEQTAELEEATAELEHTVEQLNERTVEAEGARAAAQEAEARATFLAEASRILGSGLDYETTLRRVARLAVPDVADWCTVHLVDDEGRIDRLEVAHADPAMLQVALELEQRYAAHPDDANNAVRRVMRSGTPELYAEIDDRLITGAARDATHLELLRRLKLRSAVVAPLVAHGRTLGAVTFVRSGDVVRPFAEADVRLAVQLASRAALAVSNARLYQAAEEARAEAEAANRSKSSFMAVMSHELRTPLNAIIGYLDLLRMGIPERLPDAALGQVERVIAAARHLLGLIDQVLTFSRIEAGHEEVHPTEIDLAALARESAELVQPLATRKGLGFRVTGADSPVPIQSDGPRLRQVLLNLLGNAVKFTDSGEIVLELAEARGGWLVRVRDTGVGIPPEHLARIFEPFWQADASRTRAAEGAGLGLSVCRSLVELLGGRLTVDSQPGAGSVFTVALPVEGPAQRREARIA